MSAATPDHILRQVWQNARGAGQGPIVSLKEWRAYYSDLDGWFSYWGDVVDLSLKTIGGGVYRMEGSLRYKD